MDDNEKWWLDGLTDEQRATVENPVPLPYGYQPYAQTYPYKPPATKKLAGWALGLSFVPCFCLTQVVAVVLAIVVLVRSSDGRAHGKGMAIAALCVVGAWIVGFSVWIAVDIANDTGRDGSASDGEIDFRDLREGDCFEMPEGDKVRSVQGVPCDELHDAEVYWTFELSAGDYPGDNVLLSKVQQGCATRFDEFVGTPLESSELDVFYLYPTSDGWVVGERGVSCSVYEPTRPRGHGQNRVTGTLRNARR